MASNSSSISNDEPGNYKKVIFDSAGQWIALILGLFGVLIAILLGVLYVNVRDPKRRNLKKAQLRHEIEEEIYTYKSELHSEDTKPPELGTAVISELDGIRLPGREIDGKMVVEMEGNAVLSEVEGTARAELGVE